MSVFTKDLEYVATQKFGSDGFIYTEWYSPNSDSVNFTVQVGDRNGIVSISGLTIIQYSGESIRPFIQTQLDEQF